MTRNLISAAFLITLAAPAAADMAPDGGGVTIAVSCDRGPIQAVVWDRPTVGFIDSLVAAGYGYAEATAIGERICRDPALVNDSEALSSEMRRIYHATQ